MSTEFKDHADALQTRYQALLATEPKLRARERAARLAVSEAQLVAADCGVASTELQGPAQTIFRELGTLGHVMALSRNDDCVHERKGTYEDIQAEGAIGLVLGADIDLRMFFNNWVHFYAVTEGERRSLQFFDAEGIAIHKIYMTEQSDNAAYDALVAKFAKSEKTWPAVTAYAPDTTPDVPEDAAALRETWLGLKDTHAFFPMLRKHKVSRLGALRSVGNDLAQVVDNDAVEAMLQRAASSELAIMCFVGNRGMVQIHSGPVKKLVRTDPWYNILDPLFNLHLNTESVVSTWVVNKPTSDGWVTSMELYNEAGELIVQFFGARKPGVPELTEWRELLLDLCKEPLAA
ncbi:hemin-degrading factor [Jeongeupia sp. HS-3]|uniref:hemin-degrading factor n=1 Tax=Jeongeupia sp. HS-3 TaxID=1009682 RepID=UPI0018A388A5|nr:ChuX/HutX family heme-like substrate-binding protein [Jeongeupia sp. HS-3]BCL74987.1 hemin-degrading factor [Jeongeupia sp. HS-3]